MNPVTMYGVCKALRETEVPMTVEEIIESQGFANSEANRRKVKGLCEDLVQADLAGDTHYSARLDKKKAYISDPVEHNGVTIKAQDNPLGHRIQFDKVCIDLAAMTEHNDTNGAYIKGIELLIAMGAPGENALKKMNMVQELCQLEGCLPPGMNDYRYHVFQQMKNLAKNTLNDEDYAKFYGCF